jgi:hypothetical protein
MRAEPAYAHIPIIMMSALPLNPLSANASAIIPSSSASRSGSKSLVAAITENVARKRQPRIVERRILRGAVPI